MKDNLSSFFYVFVYMSSALALSSCTDNGDEKSTQSVIKKQSTYSIQPCKNGDGEQRYKVKSWEQDIADENAKVLPPELNDGQIVFVKISRYWENGTSGCSDGQASPEDRLFIYSKETDGGIEYSFPSAYYIQGSCYIKGFFIADDSPGIHQGWTTTAFERIDSKEIAASGNFCLDN